MESLSTYTHLHGLPAISGISKSKRGGISFLKEIADGPFLFTRHNSLQLPMSCVIAHGSTIATPARRPSDSGRSPTSDYNEKPQSSHGKKDNHEKIIAVLRRIKTSISKEESIGSKKENSNSSGEKPSVESIIEMLGQSKMRVKERASDGERRKMLGQRKREPKKEESDFPSTAEVRTTRPPSNFMRRSPIPSPYDERVQDEPKNAGQELEKMTLSALKELARSRGIKGYSKLKKAELVDFLKIPPV